MKKNIFTLLISIYLHLAATSTVSAQAGILDTTFSSDGKTTTIFSATVSTGYAVLM